MKRILVVADEHLHAESVLGALAAVGYEAVKVPDSAAARAQAESGAVAIIIGAEGESLSPGRAAPLRTFQGRARRACVIVMVGERFTTSDGMAAFVNDVDTVVAKSDIATIGELVKAAVSSKRALVAALDPAAVERIGA